MKPFKSNPVNFAVLMALSSMSMHAQAAQEAAKAEAGEETLPEVSVSAPELEE